MRQAFYVYNTVVALRKLTVRKRFHDLKNQTIEQQLLSRLMMMEIIPTVKNHGESKMDDPVNVLVTLDLPDIDECHTDNGGCQQVCSNTDFGAECSCNPGYNANGSRCHGEMKGVNREQL